MARWMIRLYPASWRARYGEEIEALLSDTGAAGSVCGIFLAGVISLLRRWKSAGQIPADSIGAW